MRLDNNQQAFFALVRAGLWEGIPVHGERFMVDDLSLVDWEEVYRLSDEQSILGIITAGIERLAISSSGIKIPKDIALKFAVSALQLEQRNKTMNEFLAWLIEILRKNNVYAILVKGQGIAQCYEKPLWRASGDIDLLLNDTNYEKAKKVLMPLALDVEKEYKTFKHSGMTMQGGVVVELHGTLHSRLSKRVDNVIDDTQKDLFYGGNVRPWMNGKTQVFLPGPDNDVIFVFTHILHHYYIEGIGIRQICDWCRLLWTYKDSLNLDLLESRIRKAGLMSEWKAFAALAVDWLGMPAKSIPLYSPDKKWSRKAKRIIGFVLECGNFGHNRQAQGDGKFFSAWQKAKDFANHILVFPIDSVKYFFHFLVDGIKLASDKSTHF